MKEKENGLRQQIEKACKALFSHLLFLTPVALISFPSSPATAVVVVVVVEETCEVNVKKKQQTL